MMVPVFCAARSLAMMAVRASPVAVVSDAPLRFTYKPLDFAVALGIGSCGLVSRRGIVLVGRSGCRAATRTAICGD
jgi:hypothetical protein